MLLALPKSGALFQRKTRKTIIKNLNPAKEELNMPKPYSEKPK